MKKTDKRSVTCCFTGHRSIPESEQEAVAVRLRCEILKLADSGYIYFGAGGALGFDTLAADAVLSIKEKRPELKLILVLPCPNQAKYWRREDADKYESIVASSDKSVFVSPEYSPGCMQARNRRLVDFSSVCICYMTRPSGGTAYTVRYALRRGLKIINVAETDQNILSPS